MMKKTGLFILVVGILIITFTGLNYVSSEIVSDSGRMSITRDQLQGSSWSLQTGVLVIIIGGLIFVAGLKRKMIPIKYQNK